MQAWKETPSSLGLVLLLALDLPLLVLQMENGSSLSIKKTLTINKLLTLFTTKNRNVLKYILHDQTCGSEWAKQVFPAESRNLVKAFQIK